MFLSPSKGIEGLNKVSVLAGSYNTVFLREAVNRGLNELLSVDQGDSFSVYHHCKATLLKNKK